MALIYLALGSNRGHRRAAFHRALQALPELGIAVLRVSPVYDTAPEGLHSRRRFLNCVIEAETALPPRQLLRRLLALERRLGRRRERRGGRAAPRSLDIDLLLYGGARIATPDLTVPHPRLRGRRFVLQPLADLNPALRPPGYATPVVHWLRRAPRASLRRVDPFC